MGDGISTQPGCTLDSIGVDAAEKSCFSILNRINGLQVVGVYIIHVTGSLEIVAARSVQGLSPWVHTGPRDRALSKRNHV